nr:putative reverse transcriptase domain-containing protein [Tanacetum cinerariifolium]
MLRVLGERPEEKVRHLMSAKAEEQKLKDIVVVRNFSEVFPDDLSGLPPSKEIKFRIDLIHRATSVAKSPYRLAPSKMEELSSQLRELRDKGFIRPSSCHGEHRYYSSRKKTNEASEAVDGPVEMVLGLDEQMERRSDGTLYYLDRIWVTLKGDEEVGEGQLIGPEIVQETTKKISQIKDRLKVARDIVRKAMKKGKLAPRFVRPFEITKRIGLVAYRLRLPEELNGVHYMFHVSNLKKFLGDPTLQIPLEEVQVDAKLNFVKELVEILEHEIKKLNWSRIPIIKVR